MVADLPIYDICRAQVTDIDNSEKAKEEKNVFRTAIK